MANRRSAGLSRRRRQAMQRRRLMIAAAAAVAVIAAVILILTLPKRGGEDRMAYSVATPTPAPTADANAQSEDDGGEARIGDALDATAAPTVAPTPAPVANSARAATRPTPTAPGFLPVFKKAETTEKIAAITVDDCFQAGNLQQIVDSAIENGAHLTFFPIGENALKSQQAATLKQAWENGCELENHTFTHNGLYRCSDEELAEEVFKQQMALSKILGVEYQCHFLRPKGGDARGDQRLQKYAEQLGYYGIAHWSASSGSGNASDATLAKALEPGVIYLFHTTDKDCEKLVRFIPWVVSQGYQLVTLNEMFGYPDNETGPLKDLQSYEVPPLEPFERVYVPYKKTTYAYGVLLLQQKLVELGYLTGEPDGVYGDGCVTAVKKYQADHGLEQTGVADVELQRMIFGG